jgi:hypothetical protein
MVTNGGAVSRWKMYENIFENFRWRAKPITASLGSNPTRQSPALACKRRST